MKRRIAEVVWDDHMFQPGEYSGLGLAVQRSVGYVVKENRRVIVLALSFQKEDKKFIDTITIDKRTVRSITTLGETHD